MEIDAENVGRSCMASSSIEEINHETHEIHEKQSMKRFGVQISFVSFSKAQLIGNSDFKIDLSSSEAKPFFLGSSNLSVLKSICPFSKVFIENQLGQLNSKNLSRKTRNRIEMHRNKQIQSRESNSPLTPPFIKSEGNRNEVPC